MDSTRSTTEKRSSFEIIASEDDFGAGFKECTKCGEEKPLVEFHRDRTKPGGYKAECKSCRRDEHKKTKIVQSDMIQMAFENAAYRILKEKGL